MEKVWDELKKIEAEAQQIQTDAKDRAKKVTQQAKQDAEKLIANSRTYAEEEAQKRYSLTITEANSVRDARLKANQEVADKLKIQAQKYMEKAVSTVVDSVLEDN